MKSGCVVNPQVLYCKISNLKIAFGFHVLAEFVLSVLLFENAVNL